VSTFSEQSFQENIGPVRYRKVVSNESAQLASDFCIYINTFFQGPIPTVFDNDELSIFATEAEAQREIVDIALTRLGQFLSGERDFDDAIAVEEYVMAVDVLPDGSIVDADGNHFSALTEAI
jgi:hypothetical protein